MRLAVGCFAAAATLIIAGLPYFLLFAVGCFVAAAAPTLKGSSYFVRLLLRSCHHDPCRNSLLCALGGGLLRSYRRINPSRSPYFVRLAVGGFVAAAALIRA